MDYAFIAQILDIDGITITRVEIEKDLIRIYLKNSKDPECPECHSKNVSIHNLYAREDIRDRSFSNKKCYLDIETRVIVCHDCGNKRHERFDFVESHAHQTNRYKEYVAQLGFELSVSSISIMEDIGYKTVEQILKSYVHKRQPSDLQNCQRIGIDEFSNRKGHKNFCTLIANLDKSKPLAVLPDRKEETLRRNFSSIPQKQREKIIEVSLDMWSTFINIAREFFPNAKIVIDRFHVMKHVNKIMDKIRIGDCKTLNKEEKKHVRGIRWIMNKRSDSFIQKEREILKYFFTLAPKSKKAYKIKEEFVWTMDKTTDIEKGRIRLERWITKVEKLQTKKSLSFVKTLRKLLDYVLNYFHANTTNATLEGMINKVKVIKRRSFGVPNPYHMGMRIFLGFEEKKSLYSIM
ncbi:MAG: ISL3 family transposase [Nanoarchaeota archaeon]|nr:ISL3 family transposase [Nanoarchaeota archaeon]